MDIEKNTKISQLIKQYPFLIDFLATLSPAFSVLKNPVLRNTMGKVATIDQAAHIAGLKTDELISSIRKHIESNGSAMSEENKAATLKEIILDLHNGSSVESVKRRFQELIVDIDPSGIAAMEQQLISEGLPQEEVKRLCDVHVKVFQESLDAREVPTVPDGHPLHTLMLENRALEQLMESIAKTILELKSSSSLENSNILQKLEKQITSLSLIELHFLKKENQLFPILERHEITAPSQVMWSLDDDIRKMIKSSRSELEKGNFENFYSSMETTCTTIKDMIFKEEHILFPMALDTLETSEWEMVKSGEEEIGYAWLIGTKNPQAGTSIPVAQVEGSFPFDTGTLTLEQANLLLKNLPLDLSFVNEHDEVVYYSATKERLFPRSPGVIGRKVQNCHPPKSMHVVQQILDDFRSGTRDSADFWIDLHGKFALIRYIAIRDSGEKYKGCLEITQDITDIRNLTGEKRLL